MTPVARLPPGLLVSVRSPAEAGAAVAGGASIIDVKEPFRGPLGCADADVTAAIAAAVGRAATLTLACGELAAGADRVAAHLRGVLAVLAPAAAVPVAVKAGPAGLDMRGWRRAFTRLATTVPPGIGAVAVAYADSGRCGSPDADDIIAAAAAAGAAAILVDTFDKRGPGLFCAAGPERVAAWAGAAREAGIALAVAGRLTAEDVATAARCGATIVGVRSAACVSGRFGRIDRGQVVRLAATLAASGHRPEAGHRPDHVPPGECP